MADVSIRVVELNKARTAVYRLYDAEDRLLYVGIAHAPEYRWRDHKNDKAWWHHVARKTVEWHEDRAAALEEEARAIAAEKPLYDMSWRKTQEQPRGGYDDSADRRAVRELVTSGVQDGTYLPGTIISTVQVANECNVARCTAGYVMADLCGTSRQPGILARTRKPGRYEVRQPAA